MSVNLFPDLSRFFFYYSPIFILFFILSVSSLNAEFPQMFRGPTLSFLVFIVTFMISFALYLLFGSYILRDFGEIKYNDPQRRYTDPYAIIQSVPYTSTFILLITLTLYSITTGFINNRSSVIYDNTSPSCSTSANLFLLLLFIFLLLNDVIHHVKIGSSNGLHQRNITTFVFLLILFGVFFPAGVYIMMIMISKEKTNLFLYNFQNVVCSKTPNITGTSDEYYCKQEDNPTVVMQ